MNEKKTGSTAHGLLLGELVRELSSADRSTRPSVEGATEERVVGVHHDSRSVCPGDLFVVRRGKSYDGARFVAQAVERGAVALLAAHDEDADTLFGEGPRVPIVRVNDVRVAMAYASAAVYGHPAFGLDVIGITGTNGKTTTTHLVRAAIDGAVGKPACGVVGTIGHSYAGQSISTTHTTPESDELARVFAAMKKRGATHVAMEVSSIALVLDRVRAVRFRVAAFTNLTQDHLEFHGSMDEYAAAKMNLFTTLEPGLAVVNVTDPFGERVAQAAKCRVFRVVADPNVAAAKTADVAVLAVVGVPGGMKLSLRILGRTVELRTRLMGMHNVENVLIALGIVAALELDVDRALEALSVESGPPGRLERCDGEGDDVVVLVDYAHTPDALANVLRGLALEPGKRLVCVFGCGGDRDPTKRRPMGEAAGTHASLVVVTSDNPRTEKPEDIARAAAEGVRAAGLPPLGVDALSTAERGFVVELDRRRAIDLAIGAARPGDIVVIAGKGHEDYQIVGFDKRPFDDRVEAKRALATRRARRSLPPRSS